MCFERDSLDLGAFAFERGGRVPRLTVTYETYGDPADETVLVCHALTGSAERHERPRRRGRERGRGRPRP